MVMPVGQVLRLHLSDWMQPSANMKPRAETTKSAPTQSAQATADGVTNFPDAIRRTRSLSPWRLRRLSTIGRRLPNEQADIVHERHRRRAGAAVAGIDLDEVGRRFDTAPLHLLEHGIDPVVGADHAFDAGWLAGDVNGYARSCRAARRSC